MKSLNQRLQHIAQLDRTEADLCTRPVVGLNMIKAIRAERSANVAAIENAPRGQT